MGGQKPKHTARLEKMPRYRLGIEQFALLIRSTLHPEIIPNNTDQPTDRHAELFRTLLAACLPAYPVPPGRRSAPQRLSTCT